MEAQRDAFNGSLEHQTGVTKRSIRRDDGYTIYNIIDDVMVGDDADRVGARRSPDLNRKHFLVAVQLSLRGRRKRRRVKRMKHQLVEIDAR